MKTFGGPAVLLDRNDINTDEIIPAKYLTEITKIALKPHLLEDLLLNGKPFDSQSQAMKQAKVVITRANFGCGSSREHAVWAFEVNDINVVIAESFARIFRQNMFNCGILAMELSKSDIDALFALSGELTVEVDVEKGVMVATSSDASQDSLKCSFVLNPYDKNLVSAGGWLAFADANY
ncbi:MAG: 3-isopropylmalate dehydratase small subunit [Proteobacteria bacterium]|nr:3-isopropylmalate dehydratase small subunit [Pseudomonadota bacterium]MBU1232247.1 3-isopropylmalate dehydratase small subunit [Pseudomonadota bacterium]MBU1417066.1 3-isopropylmalate dehydratase small subunit [Pseudomonadota bacterium]MBU1453762.1 3-isopropylmalate dehydratase small subunit [Pseudomonadota bacterium]